MVGSPRKSPAELTPGWPHHKSDDFIAETARQIALVVIEETRDRGLRPLSKLIGANHSTLLNVAEGRTWPSIALVARLEMFLDKPVWPAAGDKR